ncbi:MAG: inorganic phosphate transporter [Acidobacteriaceae bacterium]|nr:inorganic phosphate transporter [Acidobacteriaceae bacterium]MBV9765627.1 inorganic phosphate transporter [Acidobacteriaceae bacterium]
MSALGLVVLIICIALIFDFVNGFHDAANSVATVVATRVLNPVQAVGMAAAFNFLAAFFLGTGVASTVGKGFVNTNIVTPYVLMAGLVGAVIWNILTWYLGLPISSSHSLIGGYAGAALAKAGTNGLIVGKWPSTLSFIVLAPLIGLVLGYLLMVAVYWIFRRYTPARLDRYFRHAQIVSASLLSCAHGTNDAQKTMGIITAVLVAGGFQRGFHVPDWVVLASAAAMGLGTLSGGWRVVRTLGTRLTRLKPRSGFCAETGAAISILFATWLGLPVSTTHVVSGAIAGVGSIQRVRAVRWNVAGDIVTAWVLTIPAAAVVSAVAFFLIHLFVRNA